MKDIHAAILISFFLSLSVLFLSAYIYFSTKNNCSVKDITHVLDGYEFNIVE